MILVSSPCPNQQVSGHELPIEVRFVSRIDAGRSRLTLMTPDGGGLALPLIEASSADTLKAKAPDLLPGAYRLHWQTLSPDGHITQGDIPFTVNR